jgi:hypothetical protein
MRETDGLGAPIRTPGLLSAQLSGLPHRVRRRGGSLARPAEHAAATVAQAGTLTMHAGDDPVSIGNFRCAQPEYIPGAQPALIVLGESVACGGQHRQESHACQHHVEVPYREQTCPHHFIAPRFSSPQDSPALFDCYLITCLITAVATHRPRVSKAAKQRAAAESNHDTSMGAFKIHRSPCTTILPAVASSPALSLIAGGCATMGTEMRRQMATT